MNHAKPVGSVASKGLPGACLQLVALVLLLATPGYAQTTNCLPAPTGLVSWWWAETNAIDATGLNNGTLENGVGFVPGMVGSAFAFNGANQFVQIPDSPSLNPTNGLTMEAWVYVSAYSTNDGVTVVGKDNPNAYRQYLLALKHDLSGWHFYALVHVPIGIVYFAGATSINTNTWYHVAMTYDNSTLSLYLDGLVDGSWAVAGPIVVTPQSLVIGGTPSGPWGFLGYIDELTLYNRPLSSQDIANIYGAGGAGKCPVANPPMILSDPRGQVGYWGGSVTFKISARGTPPLSFLWFKDGIPIPWATNSALTLTNLQSSDAGDYKAMVTNSLGMATSASATLLVNPAGVSLGLYPGLTIEGVVGKIYGIQGATNISDTNGWISLTNITLTQPTQLWFDATASVWAGNNPRRFYRVVPLP
jgi:hypothetical protein